MATSDTRIPGTNNTHRHEGDKKMKNEKNAVEPVAEIQKRNGDVNRISNPK